MSEPENNNEHFSDVKMEQDSVAADQIQICKVKWETDDLILIMEEILEGASAESVKQKLIRYVTDFIEPTGWQAIWRSCKKNNLSLEENLANHDFIVDVTNVSQENLEAEVMVKDVVKAEGTDRENIVNRKVSAPLVELYPMAEQENEAIDIQTTSEVIELLKFFYLNIWQPWDSFEELCHYNKYLITQRMKTYSDIKDRTIPPSVASEMKTVKKRAREAADEIQYLEESLGIASETEVDQGDLAHLMKLNKEVDQLKMRYDALKDPALRELSMHQEQLERKALLASFVTEEPANILVVASSVSVDDLVRTMAQLTEVLKEIPQKCEISRVKMFPSLQMALDSAQVGNVVVLLPGKHILKHLGPIGGGGSICGLGEDVSIVGCTATGDTMLDLEPSEEQRFVLKSVSLHPLREQTGIRLHTGRLTLQKCCIKGGSLGVCLLSGSKCEIEESCFKDLLCAVEGKNGSELTTRNNTFEECFEKDMKLEDDAKIFHD